MCGAIPVPCEYCGVFYRMMPLCNCAKDEEEE